VSKDDVTVTKERKLDHSNTSSNPADDSDSSHDVTNNSSSDKNQDQTEPIRVVKIVKTQPSKVRTSNTISSTDDRTTDTESRKINTASKIINIGSAKINTGSKTTPEPREVVDLDQTRIRPVSAIDGSIKIKSESRIESDAVLTKVSLDSSKLTMLTLNEYRSSPHHHRRVGSSRSEEGEQVN